MSEAKTTVLARKEALSVHERWGRQLEVPPVSSVEVAHLLGIEVKRVVGASERGRLLHSSSELGQTFTILVQSDLPTYVGRFVVAHEVGHAVLLQRHPDLAETWSMSEREAFATAFAHEVLV